MDYFKEYFGTLHQAASQVDPTALEELVSIFCHIKESQNKIMIVGNGGSSAIASHVSVDLTKAAGIRAVNFNEADLITCLANDFGYERWVEKAIEYYGCLGDIAVLISSSGMSENIVNGALVARNMGLKVITFSGFSRNNKLRNLGDLNFWVNSDVYNIIETTHQTWLLSVIDRIAESVAKQER